MSHINTIANLVGNTARIQKLRDAIRSAKKGVAQDALGQAVLVWWRDANYYGDAAPNTADVLVSEVTRELEARINW